MDTISVRSARRNEWAAILAIHHRAIHEIASADYPAEVLAVWGPLVTQPDLSQFDAKIERGQVVIVAEVNGVLVGFGELVPDNNELLALYVNPDYLRQGVGTAILNELERIARRRRLPFLQMDSSLTAAPFYQANGFEAVRSDFHVLESGERMVCVKMRKKMTG